MWGASFGASEIGVHIVTWVLYLCSPNLELSTGLSSQSKLCWCVPDLSSELSGVRAASLMWHKSSMRWTWNLKFSIGVSYCSHLVLWVGGATSPPEHCLLICIAWSRGKAPGAFQGHTLLVLPASQPRQLKLHRNLLFYSPHSPVIGAVVPRARD